ncbi:MAG TPA: NeuD/PglB/VioB family sugar acetyltransferase [Thermodesulfovibrionales bacterium]|nr:NeuD/PglB/VioB family sugar acetyltransferase [Thermodesulfovibrionales bacterium]
MKKIYIFGASYLDIIKLVDAINRSQPSFRIEGFLDDAEALRGRQCLGYPVLGGRELIADLARMPDTCFVSNVPTWPKCEQVVGMLKDLGCGFANLIHPTVDMNYVEIGTGCIIPEGCVVGGGARIGSFVTVRLQSLISHDVAVDDFVFIGPGVTVGGHARLAQGCFLGAGATIMGERSVGAGSIIGAGSVVIRDVPAGVTVAGAPARVIKVHAEQS